MGSWELPVVEESIFFLERIECLADVEVQKNTVNCYSE